MQRGVWTSGAGRYGPISGPDDLASQARVGRAIVFIRVCPVRKYENKVVRGFFGFDSRRLALVWGDEKRRLRWETEERIIICIGRGEYGLSLAELRDVSGV